MRLSPSLISYSTAPEDESRIDVHAFLPSLNSTMPLVRASTPMTPRAIRSMVRPEFLQMRVPAADIDLLEQEVDGIEDWRPGPASSCPSSGSAVGLVTPPDYARTCSRTARTARRHRSEASSLLDSQRTEVTPDNECRDLTAAHEDSGFEWVTPHTFRKPIATLIDGTRGRRAPLPNRGTPRTL